MRRVLPSIAVLAVVIAVGCSRQPPPQVNALVIDHE
jgi:hypothetical protein